MPDRTRIGGPVSGSEDTMAVVDPDTNWLASESRADDQVEVAVAIDVPCYDMQPTGNVSVYIKCGGRVGAKTYVDSVAIRAAAESWHVGESEVSSTVAIEIAGRSQA